MAVHLLQIAKKLAHDAGRIALKMQKEFLNVHTKDFETSLVSDADKACDEFLIGNIKKMFPDHSIHTEESGLIPGDGEYKWIIDPIDGTTNFVHGLPLFSISIALIQKGQPFIAVIELPAIGESFWAQKGKGAHLGNRRIHVSESTHMKEALVSTGYPYTRTGPRYEAQHKVAETVHRQVRDVRRTGSAAIDLAYIAAGRFDAYWEFDLQPWDIAAGMLLVEEAGGQVTNLDGSRLDPKKQALLATNGTLHSKFLEIFKQAGVDRL